MHYRAQPLTLYLLILSDFKTSVKKLGNNKTEEWLWTRYSTYFSGLWTRSRHLNLEWNVVYPVYTWAFILWPCPRRICGPFYWWPGLALSGCLRKASVAQSKELTQRCQTLSPFPFLGVYPFNILPWYDSVGSSLKVKDTVKRDSSRAVWLPCNRKEKWQNTVPGYF